MESKIRIFELAKELNVDSKRVLDVLQTLNVDVKNHMSTIDQKTAEQVTETVKRAPANKAETAAESAEKSTRAAAPAVKPVREANPAKASLLDDFFGAGTKPRQRVEDIKRELRPTAERPRPSAERSGAEIPARAASVNPTVAAARPVAQRASAERTAPAAAVERTAEVVAAPKVTEQSPVDDVARLDAVGAESPVAPKAVATQPVVADVVVSAHESGEESTAPTAAYQAAEADGPGRPLLAGPSRPVPAGPRAASSPMPRPAGASLVGLPTRPAPTPEYDDADRSEIDAGPRRPASGLGLPTPAGMRPAAGPRPAGPSGPSGLGLPTAPGAARPAGPRPGGFGAPRPGGFGGPRPGGFGGARRGGTGGGLAIPKVDPKVAEQAKPSDGRPKIGQGGDRKKGDAFTKRETSASRPSEEKLFGRRRLSRQQASVVERRSLKPITIEGALTVKDLAHEMGVTAAEVIKKLFAGFGIMATINQELDTDTSVLVGNEFGIEVTVKQVEDVLGAYDEVSDREETAELKHPRQPVVTIMGHVDHGKTSLLDALRSAKVAQGEAGGITQHIGAYEVELHGKKITFLDTPGHEAFTAMRARGANITDIAILVVAADDSVMPQTIESINHAKAAGVPIIVAINKIDKPGANPDKVKQDLTAHGLVWEEWGGETIMVPVSAKQQTNLDGLLENILLVAEVADLKANPDKEARGYVIEAELDKNRGPLATILVKEGTLNVGDTFVAGTAWGRVRAMFDHRGRKLKSAGPSSPAQVLGFQSVPAAGDVFRVTPDEKTARSVAEKRQAKVQAERQGTKAMSLEDFMSEVAKGEIKDLNVVIKADVQGSVEAVRGQLEKLQNEEVRTKVIHSAVGAITETDVMLAATSKAIIIGFNVRPDDRANRAASDQGIDMRLYNVIYNIVDDIKAAMTGMLAPKIEEEILGRAEVRETFKVPKAGMAAGCRVVDGKVTRNAKYRLIRDGAVVWEGELSSLRRFKDDAREVLEGFECGISLEKFQDFKPGDILEAYEMKEVKAG